MDKIENLFCTCCLDLCKGRQWETLKLGDGICERCLKNYYEPNFSRETIENYYGIYGINHSIKGI